jgi:carboxymethylenebutenolidase
MKPAPLLALLACCASLPAFAQEWAKQDLQKSPRHQEWVDVARGGRSLKAFVVYPEAKKTAAVVIIHEDMGLTDWVRDLADQVAAVGYIAVAPDLLSGMAPGGGKTSDFPSVDAARGAIYGGEDARIGATIEPTMAAMKNAGKRHEPVTYEGAGHGFMRAGQAPDASAPNKKARDDAWQRWKALLARL